MEHRRRLLVGVVARGEGDGLVHARPQVALRRLEREAEERAEALLQPRHRPALEQRRHHRGRREQLYRKGVEERRRPHRRVPVRAALEHRPRRRPRRERGGGGGGGGDGGRGDAGRGGGGIQIIGTQISDGVLLQERHRVTVVHVAIVGALVGRGQPEQERVDVEHHAEERALEGGQHQQRVAQLVELRKRLDGHDHVRRGAVALQPQLQQLRQQRRREQRRRDARLDRVAVLAQPAEPQQRRARHLQMHRGADGAVVPGLLRRWLRRTRRLRRRRRRGSRLRCRRRLRRRRRHRCSRRAPRLRLTPLGPRHGGLESRLWHGLVVGGGGVRIGVGIGVGIGGGGLAAACDLLEEQREHPLVVARLLRLHDLHGRAEDQVLQRRVGVVAQQQRRRARVPLEDDAVQRRLPVRVGAVDRRARREQLAHALDVAALRRPVQRRRLERRAVLGVELRALVDGVLQGGVVAVARRLDETVGRVGHAGGPRRAAALVCRAALLAGVPELLDRTVAHGSGHVLAEPLERDAQQRVEVVAHLGRQRRLVDGLAVGVQLHAVLGAEARRLPRRGVAAVAAASVGVDDAVVVAGVLARAEAVDAHGRVRVDLAHEAAVRDRARPPDRAAHALLGRRALLC